mgnify:CR=1 FL=1
MLEVACGTGLVTHIAIRYTFPQELIALLEGSGFRILQQYGY